jgi:hypothetical protein
MSVKGDRARRRISHMGFSDGELATIWYDWNDWDDHIDWLLTASRDEIMDWIREVDEPTGIVDSDDLAGIDERGS